MYKIFNFNILIVLVLFVYMLNPGYVNSINIQYQSDISVKSKFLFSNFFNQRIKNIDKLSSKQKNVFFSVLNTEICPDHTDGTLSYCLQKKKYVPNGFLHVELDIS
jgi:hypothetical protein